MNVTEMYCKLDPSVTTELHFTIFIALVPLMSTVIVITALKKKTPSDDHKEVLSVKSFISEISR